ncbi:cysteine desulfurase family protein [Paenibacillus xylaniclasticus]|uniref:cysteine desulfurase family protein n=1 Tax=Paenibacillus xylaniclasticus TaxID=588083 RepID=UPI000FDCBEAF|nr:MULTISPECIES: cysteine desulfurase family protein [Paenibacillus]GFN30364.1 aminotransferase V [Paenibacillus curdlanolyticus]
MLYFDHCASTPPHEEVIQTIAEVMRIHYANPSSIHQAGANAGHLIDRSRELLAKLFKTKAEEWVFTSGGTESNNLAIQGAARQYAARGKHLITTMIEHASVYETFQQLEKEGFSVTYLPVDELGRVSVQDVEAALTEETILVSVMHVNNEVGSVQPIAEIGRLLAGRPRTLFHVDAVQSVGKLPIDIAGWGIDLLSGSAHKVKGPKGVGILYIKSGLKLHPILYGGEQERSIRPGTSNTPAIVASAKAFRMAMEKADASFGHWRRLRSRLIGHLANVPELVLNGSADGDTAPHIVHFSYPGMKPEVIVHALEQKGFIVSTKSACSSKDDKPSRVIMAMSGDTRRAAGGIRISFGYEHTEDNIDHLAAAIRDTVTELKPMERRS